MSMKTLDLGEFGYSLVFNQSRDLTNAEITIFYTKPDGTEGSWAGTLDGTTTFYYTLQEDDIDQVGVWVLWLFAKWTNKELWSRTSFRVKSEAPIDRRPEDT